MKRLVVLLVFGIAMQSWAVPQQINYQGFLANPAGTPLDTVVSMTFELYNAATSGTQLWTETQPSCTVRTGLFNVLLGTVTAIPDSFNRAQVWLGVTVGSNSEMTPRVRFVSVPYSYRVGTVDGASGGTVGGKLNVGAGNTNTGYMAFVFGETNTATGSYATVSGGSHNVASGASATVCGGGNEYLGNSATGSFSFIGGGLGDVAVGGVSTVCGGVSNRADGDYSFIGGGNGNRARGFCSVVVGGGAEMDSNSAQGNYSAISGGRRNIASGISSAVIGGFNNQATGNYASVCGGEFNLAYGRYSTVGGGRSNNAGDYSFVAGRRANSWDCGQFVWADCTNTTFGVSIVNSFNARASGGVYFYTNSSYSAGSYLAAGSSAWTGVSDSTKKRNIRPVDTKQVLDKVTALPIKQWSYKAQDPSIEHIGPMAQDFWKLFHLGEDSLGISTIDPDGIALAAIQELIKQNNELRKRNTALELRMVQLETQMRQITSRSYSSNKAVAMKRP